MPQPPLTISTSAAGPGVRVSLTGELDRSSLPPLAAELRELERTRPSTLELDLRRLRFVDARGLREILRAARRAKSEGRCLTVSNPSSSVRRFLALTAIDRTVSIRFDDPGAGGVGSARHRLHGSSGAGLTEGRRGDRGRSSGDRTSRRRRRR